MEDEQKLKKKQTKKVKVPKSIGLEKYFKKNDTQYELKSPPQMSENELQDYLKKDLDILNQQIQDLELKRACIEDKLREINKQKLQNGHPDNNNLQYLLENVPNVVLDATSQYETLSQAPLLEHVTGRANPAHFIMNDELQLIEQNFQLLPKTKQELWKYFGYNEDLQNSLKNIDTQEQDNLVKLAEYFGLKSKIGNKQDMKKLKQQLTEILEYCTEQEFSEKIRRIYKAEFLQSIEIKY